MKCVYLVHNGVEITEEDIESLYNTVIEIWEAIKLAIRNLVKRAREVVGEMLKDFNPVGYKRLLRIDELTYKESISEGKSNNWRMNNGLPPIRLQHNYTTRSKCVSHIPRTLAIYKTL